MSLNSNYNSNPQIPESLKMGELKAMEDRL